MIAPVAWLAGLAAALTRAPFVGRRDAPALALAAGAGVYLADTLLGALPGPRRLLAAGLTAALFAAASASA